MKLGIMAVFALVMGGFAGGIVRAQAPSAIGVDGKQHTLIAYVLESPRQSYEKVCGFFYRSEVLGSGSSSLVGFQLMNEGQVVRPVARVKYLSIKIDESAQIPTAQKVSDESGGHYILRMNSETRRAGGECISDIVLMK